MHMRWSMKHDWERGERAFEQSRLEGDRVHIAPCGEVPRPFLPQASTPTHGSSSAWVPASEFCDPCVGCAWVLSVCLSQLRTRARARVLLTSRASDFTRLHSMHTNSWSIMGRQERADWTESGAN
eukprot:scaffold41383_cov63-Phaeocystis_antarctica.AAC.1